MTFSLPFSKQKDETDQAWAACLTYCLLPPSIRSIRRAESEYHRNSKKAPSTGWEAWSSRYKWQERASLLDTQRATEILEEEKRTWLKTKDDFNEIAGDYKKIQSKLLDKFNQFLDEHPEELETLNGFKKASEIFESLTRSDKHLWDRFLKSIGIEALLMEKED